MDTPELPKSYQFVIKKLTDEYNDSVIYVHQNLTLKFKVIDNELHIIVIEHPTP